MNKDFFLGHNLDDILDDELKFAQPSTLEDELPSQDYDTRKLKRAVLSREKLQSSEKLTPPVEAQSNNVMIEQPGTGKVDMSNVSNLTSFEFESKILKNNYKEYLLG